MKCLHCGKEAEPKPGHFLPSGWIWINDDPICSSCAKKGTSATQTA